MINGIGDCRLTKKTCRFKDIKANRTEKSSLINIAFKKKVGNQFILLINLMMVTHLSPYI